VPEIFVEAAHDLAAGATGLGLAESSKPAGLGALPLYFEAEAGQAEEDRVGEVEGGDRAAAGAAGSSVTSDCDRAIAKSVAAVPPSSFGASNWRERPIGRNHHVGHRSNYRLNRGRIMSSDSYQNFRFGH